MAFEPNHPYYPPKEGRMPGRSKATAGLYKKISLVLREEIPAELYMDWHVAIAMNHSPFLDRDEETGEWFVTWDERGGLLPPLRERDASMRWLADRAYGQAAQSIHLEAELSLHVNAIGGSLPIGVCSPTQLAAIRAALEAPKPVRTPADNSDAEDADFVEVGASESETASEEGRGTG